MFKRLTWALALATSTLGTSAMAAQHYITFVEGGFFPEITYANVGDTVIFTNEKSAGDNAVAMNGTWETKNIPPNPNWTEDNYLAGDLSDDYKHTILLTSEIEKVFAYGSDLASQAAYEEEHGHDIPKGYITFDPVPGN